MKKTLILSLSLGLCACASFTTPKVDAPYVSLTGADGKEVLRFYQGDQARWIGNKNEIAKSVIGSLGARDQQIAALKAELAEVKGKLEKAEADFLAERKLQFGIEDRLRLKIRNEFTANVVISTPSVPELVIPTPSVPALLLEKPDPVKP